MDKQNESNDRSNHALTLKTNDTAIRSYDFTDPGQLAAFEAYAKLLIATPKSNISSVPEAIAVYGIAKELNVPFLTAARLIYFINGRLVTDVNLIKSLLLRAGVTWECTKKYAPQYQYTDGNNVYNQTELPEFCVITSSPEKATEATTDTKIGVYPLRWYVDLNGNVYNEFGLSDKVVKAINKSHAIKLAKEGQFPVIRTNPRPYDWVTEYTFRREIKTLSGIREIVSVSSFSYNDAIRAELITKDNYKHYPQIMIGHRAFVNGARDIADDVLHGLYSKDEISSPLVDDSHIDDYIVEEVTSV